MDGLLASQSGVNVEAFPRADLLLQFGGPAERIACEPLASAVIERLGLLQAPQAHRTFGVDTHTLVESASRFIVPVIVEQVQSLVEPDLSFWRRGDLQM